MSFPGLLKWEGFFNESDANRSLKIEITSKILILNNKFDTGAFDNSIEAV